MLSQWYEDVRNVLLMRNQRVMMNTHGIEMHNPSQQSAMAVAQAAVAHAASQQMNVMGNHNHPHPR